MSSNVTPAPRSASSPHTPVERTPLERAPLGAWYMLVVLLIAYTLSFLDRTLLSLLIAPVKQDLGLSDTGISLLLGFAFALLYTVVGVPLGYLADRTNRRRLIITGIVFWSTMTALCGLAKNFWSLFAARIGVGIGEATLTPAAYSILSDSFPRKRLGRVMAIYSVGLPLGSGLALGLGGVLIDWITSLGPVALPFLGVLAPWRLSFIFVGVSGLAVVLLMLSVREPKRRKNITTANNDTTNNGTQTSGEIGLVAFVCCHPRTLSAHFIGISILALVIYGNMMWIPAFLGRTYGISISEIGTTYGFITASCGAIGLLIGGFSADWLFARGRSDAHLLTVLLSALLCWPLFVMMPLMPTAGWAFAALVPMTIVSTIHGGIAGAALQLMTPNHLRARIITLYFLVANIIGVGLGPTLIALLSDYVLRDEAMLRYAMAGVSAVLLPVSALIITTGLKSFRAAVQAQD